MEQKTRSKFLPWPGVGPWHLAAADVATRLPRTPPFSRLLRHAGGYSRTILTPNLQGVLDDVLNFIDKITETFAEIKPAINQSRIALYYSSSSLALTRLLFNFNHNKFNYFSSDFYVLCHYDKRYSLPFSSGKGHQGNVCLWRLQRSYATAPTHPVTLGHVSIDPPTHHLASRIYAMTLLVIVSDVTYCS